MESQEVLKYRKKFMTLAQMGYEVPNTWDTPLEELRFRYEFLTRKIKDDQYKKKLKDNILLIEILLHEVHHLRDPDINAFRSQLDKMSRIELEDMFNAKYKVAMVSAGLYLAERVVECMTISTDDVSPDSIS